MKQLALILFFACSLGYAHAQAPHPAHAPVPKLSLNLLGGYVFNDNVTTDQFYGKINGGFQWQAGLEFGLKQMYGLELYYVRQDATVDIDNYLGVKKSVGTGINYVLLGGKRYAYLGSENLQGWGGISLGAAFGNNKDNGETFSKFAWGLRVGLKAKPNSQSKIGFLFQAQLLSAVQAAGGGFYFGTGGGGVGVSTYSTIYQFGLSGGLAIALK